MSDRVETLKWMFDYDHLYRNWTYLMEHLTFRVIVDSYNTSAKIQSNPIGNVIKYCFVIFILIPFHTLACFNVNQQLWFRCNSSGRHKYNLSFKDPSTECVWGLKEVRDSLQTSRSVVINCSLSCTIVKDLWAFQSDKWRYNDSTRT